MSRLKPLAGAVVLVLLGAVPAVADHIQEPTAPITGIGDIRAFDYPRRALDVCDPASGFVATPGLNLRIEVDVEFTERPSEHWSVQAAIGPVVGFNRDGTARARYDTALLWRHQNASPHSNTTAFAKKSEVFQWNEKAGPAGWYAIDVTIAGTESETTVKAQCVFEVQS